MKVQEAMLKRRSVRKFTNESVSDEIIDSLLHFGMSGPSACNRQPWEFFVVKNPDVLQEFKKVSMFSKYDAPLAIVVCGNMKCTLPMKISDYWIQDCSAAIQNILLGATSFGLGSVWCGLQPQKGPTRRMTKILQLEEHIVPLGLIYIGYPETEPVPRDQYDEKKVHYIK